MDKGHGHDRDDRRRRLGQEDLRTCAPCTFKNEVRPCIHVDQEKKALGRTCKLEVVPDSKSGRGYEIRVIGDCSDELEQIKENMGPQGYRYIEKRFILDE